MKYRNKETGVILEPRNAVVDKQLQENKLFEEYRPERPISQMNKMELLAKAAALALPANESMTNDMLVELIKAGMRQ